MNLKLIAITLMILLFSSFVFAEENTDIDSNVVVTAYIDTTTGELTNTTVDLNTALDTAINQQTISQIRLMQESNFGAEVRILQLQEATLKSYLIGEETINLLSLREDTNELSAIFAEISLLKDEIFNLDANSENAVEEFVAVKRDITNAVSNFRTAVAGKLTVNEKSSIRFMVQNNAELNELRNTIKNKIRNVNSERANNMLQKMNVVNTELTAKIYSRDIGSNEIKDALKNEYLKINEEKKLMIKNEILVDVNARNQNMINEVNTIVNNYLQVQKTRIQNRFNQLTNEQKEFLEQKKQQDLNNITNIQNKLEIMNKNLSQVGQATIKTRINSNIGGNSR